MPELPDVELYLHALRPRLVGQTLERVRIASPFLLRTVDPPLHEVEGRTVDDISRIGKRIVWRVSADRPRESTGPGRFSTPEVDTIFVVIHLMIAGRFRWTTAGGAIPGRIGLAAFDFSSGTLILTEAGARRRASLWLVRGRAALEALDPGGLNVLTSTLQEFTNVITSENHTLKRALTDPRLLDGIGNAYSDEILHAARLSPMQLTSRLDRHELIRLHAAAIHVLDSWRDRLIRETGHNFPDKVTAFREGMAVHGRYGKPCPVCGTPIQRIRYAANEASYCPTCQTGGRLLADRALSRLLKDDWPRSLEELEQHMNRRRGGHRSE